MLGATGRPIDMATVFIMGISLGIAVDDTSFFVHEYLDRAPRRERRAGVDARATAGPSMVATCVVIVLGFSVLLASSFTPMRTFGGMTAVGLVLAMLCDVFVLPFLLLLVFGQDEGTSSCRTMLAVLAPFLALTPCSRLARRRPPETGRDIARNRSRCAVRVQDAQGVRRDDARARQRDRSASAASASSSSSTSAADAYDQARITINAPTALKDTQLISWSSGSGEDQQWLVTPRTQRAQRIADRGRQAAFVSSDFSYEDILKWQVDDYDYTRVGQGPCPAGTLHHRRREAHEPLLELHAC